MWSDNDIDNAFRRLDPAEPEPTPFPLDGWLQLDARLDEAVVARAVRRRLWQFFAAEVAAVLLVGLGWAMWPGPAAGPGIGAAPAARATSTPGGPARLAAPRRAAPPAPAALAPSAAAAAVATTTAQAAAPPAEAPGTAAPGGAPTTGVARLVPLTTGPEHGGLAVAGRPGATAIRAGRPATAARMAVVAAGGRGPAIAARARPAGFSLARPGYEAGPAAYPGAIAETKGRGHSPAGRRAGARRAPVALSSSATGARLVAAGPTPALVAGRPTAEVAVLSGTASEAAVAAAASHAPAAPAVLRAALPATGSAATGQPADAAAAEAPLSSRPAALLPPVAAALPTPLAPAAVEPAPQPPVLRPGRLLVGLVAAPDVSTVRFAGVQAPHLNAGLTLEYRLGPRLRLSTGLLRSTKSYVARRDDYDWGPYKGRVYAHDFADVEGSCTVFDVPLNLRYDLLVRPAYRLVGSVGLSSFFMQRESYYYDWADANGPHTWTGAAVNQNRHLFSILNLAAGAEHSLGAGHRWSLLAEPYVKVPLAGVGLGKVKLLSAGVYLGLKYAL